MPAGRVRSQVDESDPRPYMSIGDSCLDTDREGQNVTRRLLPVVAFGLFLSWPGAVPISAQDLVSVTGRVLDHAAGTPIENAFVELEGTGHRAFTDSQGAFGFTAVTPGAHLLSVVHLTFGTRAESLDIPSSGRIRVTVRLSESAIELEPVVASALSRAEIQRRASGSRLYHLNREQLAGRIGSLGDALGARVPGISLNRSNETSSTPTCVEFRRPASFQPGCHPPMIILDGIRISAPTWFLRNVPLDHVESVTVIPSSSAGVGYGTGSGWGVIQIETLRPGNPGEDRDRATGVLTTAYNWDLEPSGHPWMRTFSGAALGTLGGLAIAVGASGDCSPLKDPRQDACGGNRALLSSIATFTLPVAAGAFGANLFGKTERSRGKVVYTAISALVPMFSGYFFATPRPGTEFESQKIFGRVLVVAGIPIAATLADRVFRSGRGN